VKALAHCCKDIIQHIGEEGAVESVEQRRFMNGNRLKILRERHGFSQDELARRCGITSKHLRRFEAEGGNPSAKTIIGLSKALGVSSDYLLGLVDEESGKYHGDKLTDLEIRFLSALRQGDLVSVGDALYLLGEMIQFNANRKKD
jgi:transcriptional regulator with XRE-family HTH domain